jgi:hydroxymethylbilane synthase
MTAQSLGAIRIGTRGSALALTQARHIAGCLAALGCEPVVEVVRTAGDADQVRPFAQVGQPGLFVRELESALLEDRIDVAVHCYKDLPSLSPADLVVAAMPEREDPRDRLLIAPQKHAPERGLLPLEQGARVGTASARRQALLRHLRGDLACGLLRGNVPTRIAKLVRGEFDAIVLAGAGLERLERAARNGEGAAPFRGDLIQVDLDPRLFVPAPSQGALALQVRAHDGRWRETVARLDDERAHRSVRVERELLALVDAGCQVPFGAWCVELEGGEFELHAVLETGGELRRSLRRGPSTGLARQAFEDLLPEGVAP